MLAYDGCDQRVGERILGGEALQQSANEYDWLGPGSYFWESNPGRALEFARETQRRKALELGKPFVVGAVIDLGLCLDLTTAGGMEWVKTAHDRLVKRTKKAGWELPKNSVDGLRRNLDCAVLKYLHEILREEGQPPIDTVKGIFVEGEP